MPLNYSQSFLQYQNFALEKFKSATRINLKWLSHLGTHWTQYGLMAHSGNSIGWFWPWRPLFGFVISLVYFIKILLVLYYDTYNSPDFAIASGDVFVFAIGTHASWIYCNLLHLIAQSYAGTFFLHVALQQPDNNSDMLWFDVVQLMAGGNFGDMMDKRSGRKLLKATAAISKVLSQTTPALLIAYGFLVILPYLLHLPLNGQFFLGIFHGTHYIIFAFLVGQLVAIKAGYFLCFCFYVSFSLDGICGKLTKAMNLYPTRCLWLGKYISRQIHSMTDCVYLVRSCNGYLGEKIKPLFATVLSAGLVYLYSIPTAASLSEFLFLGLGLTYSFFNTVYFFTSASFVKQKLTLCYGVLNRVQLKAKGFRTKWSVMLILEMVASKKKRIGFEIKDWRKLNNWSLLKLIMLLSSVYVLMIKFGRKL